MNNENYNAQVHSDVVYKHWQARKDSSGILWLGFDREDSSVNSIHVEVLTELGSILDGVEKHLPKGVIFHSLKKTGFIAGADVKSFSSLKTQEEAMALMQLGQGVFSRIEHLSVPTLAMIHGFCLGGGCELALACQYRVALDDEKTTIGLPEVMLGIHPGWGGCVRLPKLIGIQRAMPLILSGKSLSAKKAQKIGLVDAAVAQRDLKRASLYFIHKQPKSKRLPFLDKVFNASVIRPLLAKKMYHDLKKKVSRDHYPAPFAVVDNWKSVGLDREALAYQREAESITRCMHTPAAKNLVDIFLTRERLKAEAKKTKANIKRVHVVGAGVMGGDIAAWCALKGFEVTLQDRNIQAIAPAIKRAHRLFKRKLKKPRLIQAVMDRLIPDVRGCGVESADVIIEAIYENLSAKSELFRNIEQRARPDAILATNTSSIPLDDIANSMNDPSRLVGIHFFNPVPQMFLVEIVHAPVTDENICQLAASFVVSMGKMPLMVKSQPGFLVNRVLVPYLMEAMRLFEEGVAPEVIDRSAKDFGMPMGPIRLADQVGLDICLSVANNLAEAIGFSIPERLKTLVSQKQLGCKTGHGFYTYKDGKAQKNNKVDHVDNQAEIADRLILSMLNESVACWRKQIVISQDHLDIGMIFGTGFAPFRGGPMHYINSRGIDEIIARLEGFSQRFGDRFAPDEGWAMLLSQAQQADRHVAIEDSQVHAEDAALS